jgi:molybdate transport system substrate-binding protein
MAKPDVKVIFGDPEVAAIGKIGKKILEQNGLYKDVKANIVATFPTMNELMMQTSLGQGDAALNWWDTVKAVEDIDVVQIPPEQNQIKVIPIGVTTFTEKENTAKKFVEFCASDEGKAIFEKHGFVTYPDPRYESE